MPKIKVMDVSKPGATTPDASGKPVIVGHKPMVADPMVAKSDEVDSDTGEKKAAPKPMASTGKKIEPISDDLKTSSPKDSKSDKEEPAKKEESPEANESESKPEPTKPAETPAPPAEDDKPAEEAPAEDKPSDDKVKADAEAKAVEAEAEKQTKIQELVDSKKYFVKIDDSKSGSFGAFFLTMFIILLLGVVGLALLVDAEILDLGIGLPFDLIK